MTKPSRTGWTDLSGLKCSLPPPGMCLSPANPYTIPATSRSSPPHPKKEGAPSVYGAGVYYDRHRGGYVAYVWISSERKKFVIGTSPTYSEALIERQTFLGTM